MKKFFLAPYVAGLCLCISLFVGTAPVQANNLSVEVQQERDTILSLLALVFVHNDWQTSATVPPRGHNIGSVLVNENGIPVFWTRNTVKIHDNSTQHGEVRLATQYLSNIQGNKYMPEGYVLYTSLEPCVMCTGMLAMVQTGRVVYVQEDPEYGKIPELLKLREYPRQYQVSTPSGMKQKNDLDQEWKRYNQAKDKSITEYLLTNEAEAIYISAADRLNSYVLEREDKNKLVLTAARLLANSALPELTQKSRSSQKIWQIKDEGGKQLPPTLFIEYLDWGNTMCIAQIVANKFYICTTGNCAESEEIQYKVGEEKWSSTIAGDRFTHRKENTPISKQSKSIAYKGWDNATKEGSVQDILLPN